MRPSLCFALLRGDIGPLLPVFLKRLYHASLSEQHIADELTQMASDETV